MIAEPLISKIFEMPVTWLLMMSILLISFNALLQQKFFLNMLLHPMSIIQDKQYYRLVTADFVHNDILHLLINELMLFFVCGNLEKHLRAIHTRGSAEYTLIYLTSLFSGSVAVTLINRRTFEYLSAGASGSILGCLFSNTILQPDVIAFYVPFIGGVKNQFAALIYISGLIYYRRRSKNAVINHDLHFFGALGGIIITLVMFLKV